VTGQPVPPENVRVRLADGRVVPVETVYRGEVDGLHRWEAVRPVDEGVPPSALLVGMLPGRTTVCVDARWLE
jgi:hypothetical protein